jgi:histidine triad (HIT) family protein
MPANIIQENDLAISFYDINPTAPLHALIVPKIHVANINDISITHKDYLTAMMLMAKDIGQNDDFRLVINNGPTACQSVFHLHMHLLAGRNFNWPAG